MKRVHLEESWPESWKYSYPYDLQEVYGEVQFYGYAYAYATRRQLTLDLVARAARPPARVLDVAAAQGNFSLALAELGYDVTWNDLRADLADYVKLKHERGTIAFAPGNVFELGFDACFDVVLITEIIEHVAHPDQFLAKIARLVKPGGHVVMTTPNGGYFRNGLPRFTDFPDPGVFESAQFKPNADGHIFLLHMDEIPLIAKPAGLVIEEIRLSTNFLTNGHVKTEWLLKLLPRGCVMALERCTQKLPLAIQRRINTNLAALLRRPA
jgi:2-polyprenyl-6-hydroxyphenyl methylase/3-demethylubiquinone-9 3-methyltransferase